MLNSYIWLRVSDANHATICSCLDVIFCIMRQYTIVLILKYLFFKDFVTDYFFIIHSLTCSLQGQLNMMNLLSHFCIEVSDYIYIFICFCICVFLSTLLNWHEYLQWVFFDCPLTSQNICPNQPGNQDFFKVFEQEIK